MKMFEHAYNVLNKVYFESIPFHIAVKSSLKIEKKKIDSDFRKSIYALSGCVLRHFYVFERVIKTEYPEVEEKNVLLISLALANSLFTKTVEEKELIAFIKKETELDVSSLLTKYDESKKLISEEVRPESDDFYHLRYNLPLWLVRMWRKNCGPILSKKLYRSLSLRDFNSSRINSNNITDEKFFEKYPEYKSMTLASVAYNKELKNIKIATPIVNEDAINSHIGYTYLCNQLDLDIPRGIAIYGGVSNDVLLELYARLGRSLKIDYLAGNQKHFFEVKGIEKKYGLMDLSIYECSYEAIETCISKPVHTFILCPENTYFQGLIDNPDYFLFVKQEDLDKYIGVQEKVLEESIPLIEDDGYLVYVLPTVCKNESKRVIRNFLEKHEEFSLVEEKQLFPFDKYQTMLYFSILRKEAKHD